jgi:hypothetical protein
VDAFTSCFADVEHWMTSNRLKLNSTKSEVMWLGTKQKLKQVSIDRVHLLNDVISTKSCVRNLGVVFDSELGLTQQVNAVAQSCFFQLRQLWTVRRQLSTDAAKVLVNAFVASRVDYCNSIYHGATVAVHRKLQSIINSAARLVTGVQKFEHITPSLKQLHWLRVPERILFKQACIVRQALLGKGPVYLQAYLTPLASSAGRFHLPSAGNGDLFVPRAKTVRAGERSFRLTGPRVWNSLPSDVRSSASSDTFNSKLKTYCFNLSYP